jgi:hypothetical protein
VWEGEYSARLCALEKWISAETIPGMGGERVKGEC